MSLSELSTAPSQQAINGALDRYVEGGNRDDLKQMRSGLSVLRHATEAQIHLAVPVVQANRHLAEGEIQTMLESYGDNTRNHLSSESIAEAPKEKSTGA